MPNENKMKPSVRYANAGGKFCGIVGLLGALGYAMSPSNPNRGNLLSLKQDLIIFGAVSAFYLIGSGVGYVLGKWVEGRASNRV